MRRAALPLLTCCLVIGPARQLPSQTNVISVTHAFAGRWDVVVTLDSVSDRIRDTPFFRMIAASGDSILGTLIAVVRDPLGVDPNTILFTLDLRFEPLLGRPMPCYRSGEQRQSQVMTTPKGYLLFFTGGYDCGFHAVVQPQGDTAMVGKWVEDARQGHPSLGQFRMRRVRG